MKKITLFILALGLFLAPDLLAQSFSRVVSADGEAVLTAFLPEHPTGQAILAFPGGGYRQTSIGNNAQWAPLYNSLGIAYFILKYRMPEGHPETTLSDAEGALRMIRDSAAVWGVNPRDIGVMGTSAGGHLASTLATHLPPEQRPAFQILFYPVITFGEGCHRGSRDNFLGEGAGDPAQIERYSNEKQVDAATPPAIIFASNDDRGVPPERNAAAYYTAMAEKGCFASLHIYPEGGHGWTFASPFRYHDQVVDELTAWLQATAGPASRTLVAYFSRTGQNYTPDGFKDLIVGNTLSFAVQLRSLTGADIFRIERKVPYGLTYEQCAEEASAELKADARPELLSNIDISGYDVIYLGWPCWCGTMPMPVWTFLQNHDWTGKTVIPFTTHEGSGWGNGLKDLEKMIPSARILPGLEIPGHKVATSGKQIADFVANH